ncbi:MAG: polymer-forming cytoskeletal protein [Salinibacter sp.]|uniref:polymer-forming cytoskeletal protein n=1 Tax=Salinibacter sp. TaxID=2065818 RepID=UPI0035D4D9CA
MANQPNAVQDQVNLIGEGTVFEGTVRAESDIRASGRIIGTLDVEGKVMIAEGGSVEGEILATDADIAGEVQGEIHIDERLVLKSTAQVDGVIETDRLVVEEGAQFTGECEMGTPISTNGTPSDEENARTRESASGRNDEEDSADQPVGVSSVDDSA